MDWYPPSRDSHQLSELRFSSAPSSSSPRSQPDETKAALWPTCKALCGAKKKKNISFWHLSPQDYHSTAASPTPQLCTHGLGRHSPPDYPRERNESVRVWFSGQIAVTTKPVSPLCSKKEIPYMQKHRKSVQRAGFPRGFSLAQLNEVVIH